MMSNVIEIAKFKRKDGDKQEWLADLSLFQTEEQYTASLGLNHRRRIARHWPRLHGNWRGRHCWHCLADLVAPMSKHSLPQDDIVLSVLDEMGKGAVH